MAKSKSNPAPFLKGGGAKNDVPKDDDLPPAFSFEKMQDGSGNSFNCCEDEDRLKLAGRFFMLSRIPWSQIRAAPAKGLGAEQMPRYRIKRPIPASVTPDVEAFTSLHYVGNKRFVGYKVSRIFYVLWIDHNYSVYDHG